MITSAKRVRARKFHTCGTCNNPIHPKEEYVRVYGYAHPGDKPYALALHEVCIGTDTREKLRRA